MANMSFRANYGQRSSRATVISSPPSRKLIQKEPIRAEIRKVAPAQRMGLHSSRLQNMIPPPSAKIYAEDSGIMTFQKKGNSGYRPSGYQFCGFAFERGVSPVQKHFPFPVGALSERPVRRSGQFGTVKSSAVTV